MSNCGCDNQVNDAICNCSIIGQDNTTIDLISSPGDVVVKSPFVEITSDNDSVTINKTTTLTPNKTVFDLSVTNQGDLKVAVAPGCSTGGTIQEVIQVDTTGPLTRSQNGCQSYNLGFDLSQIDTSDEKVKRDSSCSEVFGKNLFSAGTGIEISNLGCSGEISVSDDQFTKPMVKNYLYSPITMQYGHGNQAELPHNGWFPIYTSGYEDTDNFHTNNSQLFGVSADPKSNSISDGSGNALAYVIPKTGKYRVWMSVGFGVNRGVEACRVSLIGNINGNWRVLLNTGYANSNNYSLAEHQSVNTPTPEEYRFWNGQGGSDVLLLEQGDTVYGMFGRMNNATSGGPGDATTDGGVMLIGTGPFGFNPRSAGNQQPSAPEFGGTYRGLERVCDDNGDSRFYK